MIATDVLVIGSGIAGLTYALKVSRYFEKHFPEYTIHLVTKAKEDETNTKYAQGGIAVVSDFLHDSYEKHIRDTINAGAGLCKEDIVEKVIKDGPQRINEMTEWGTDFDKDENGMFELGKEGGHSVHRVIHHKDDTGSEIEQTLLNEVRKAKNITVLNFHFAIDLITQHHLGQKLPRGSSDIACFGIYAMNQLDNHITRIVSKITVLASGGMGQVYYNTTNPAIATGDGLAMSSRAGAIIENMEFIQFHPTGLFNPGERPSFLITEAVRGFGGILKTLDGESFMYKYDPRESLAPRDIVARAIDNEMKRTGDDFVGLDCRHLNPKEFSKKFPNIYQKCISLGIDPAKNMIPVVPACHYAVGGIKTDWHGRTTIKNLYAIGECASTGLHGANRLASNSLLEALVFAHNAFEDTIESIGSLKIRTDIPDWNEEGTMQPKEKVLITHKRKELQVLMSDYVSIVRTNKRLQEALIRLRLLYEETENLYNAETLSPQLCELRNMIHVAYLITRDAMDRKSNIGLHYNIDLVKTP